MLDKRGRQLPIPPAGLPATSWVFRRLTNSYIQASSIHYKASAMHLLYIAVHNVKRHPLAFALHCIPWTSHSIEWPSRGISTLENWAPSKRNWDNGTHNIRSTNYCTRIYKSKMLLLKEQGTMKHLFGSTHCDNALLTGYMPWINTIQLLGAAFRNEGNLARQYIR